MESLLMITLFFATIGVAATGILLLHILVAAADWWKEWRR